MAFSCHSPSFAEYDVDRNYSEPSKRPLPNWLTNAR
jgi:hypothetical protein